MKNLDNKLQKYQALNKGLKSKKTSNTGLFAKQSLAVLSLPILTLGSANAQCLGPVNGGIPVVIPNNGSYAFDLDGDGTPDASVFLSAGTFLQIRNAAGGAAVSFFNTSPAGTASVATFADGNPVVSMNPAADGFIVYNNGNIGAITSGNSGNIGFKIGSNFGFITLGVTVSGGTHSITISERGTSQAGGAIAGTCSSLLPVELTSFKSKVENQSIHLYWTTASEEINAGFELQRSIDGDRFQTLNFIEGAGTTSQAQNYQYEDNSKLTKGQTYYYRLKQIDFDGNYAYSQIVTEKIKVDESTLGNFYPNPAKGQARVEYNALEEANNLVVIVYNLSGQVLHQETQAVAKGLNVLDFDFSDLGEGNFYVKFQSNKGSLYQKLSLH